MHVVACGQWDELYHPNNSIMMPRSSYVKVPKCNDVKGTDDEIKSFPAALKDRTSHSQFDESGVGPVSLKKSLRELLDSTIASPFARL